MKIKQLKNLTWILSALLVFGLGACKKEYNSTGFTAGTGMPTITSVHTLSKSDTSKVPTVITKVDGSGNVVKDTVGYAINPAAFDSLTTSGQKQNYYIIYGTNLGNTTKITFNGVTAYFNRALITDKSLIVSVPTTVPTVGAGATNKLVVTTLKGSVTYNFVTLTPVPTVTDASDYDFWSGSQITLNGFGFATVKSVAITGSSAVPTIVGQTDGALTLQFPTVDVNSANLVLTYVYNSAGDTKVSTTKLVFNNLDNAYNLVFKGSLISPWGANSWSGKSAMSTGAVHSYNQTSSYATFFPSNGWKLEGFNNWYPSYAYDASYKYFSFWVKGGTVDRKLFIVSDKMGGGYGNGNKTPPAATIVDVPAGVWTFYKIPLGAPSSTSPALLNLWQNGSPIQQLGFWFPGASTDPDETIYFDEVAFLK
jgi:hypothetical protein